MHRLKGAEGTPSGYSNQSIAIGDQTKAIGDQSIAIGADVIAKGNSSVAIGGDDVDKIAQDAELSKTYTEITGGVLKAGSYPTTGSKSRLNGCWCSSSRYRRFFFGFWYDI